MVAFKNKRKPKERVELVSLIDMIFILLVFFLVTSFVIRMPMEERSLAVPTPENTLGRAQIVLQFIDQQRVFWLDESSANIVDQVESSFGYLSADNLRRRILDELIQQNTYTIQEVEEKLQTITNRAAENAYARYFVLIRCPNELPYYHVINIISKLSETPYRNVKYGCVGGTLSEIRNCERITTVVEDDAQGRRRKNIQIDF